MRISDIKAKASSENPDTAISSFVDSENTCDEENFENFLINKIIKQGQSNGILSRDRSWELELQ